MCIRLLGLDVCSFLFFKHKTASEVRISDWSSDVCSSDLRDIAEVGCYRTSPEPMQIVSGPLHAPRVHYEAPPSGRVPSEMAAFIAWFNDTAPNGTKPLSAIMRAGIAHIWFESIHPFEDGNGRIGRAIAEKDLAQESEERRAGAECVRTGRSRWAQ